jgi:transposase-like protein
VDVETRLAEARQCILVIIGADASGQKEVVDLWVGDREREQSWQALLLDRHRRGLEHGPTLAVGDGVLGCWKALRPVYGQTRWQWCVNGGRAPRNDGSDDVRHMTCRRSCSA